MIHGYQVRTHYTRHKRCLPTEAAKQSRSKLLAGAQIIMHLLLCLNGPKVHFSVWHDTKSLSKRRLICWDSFSSLIRWDGPTLVASTFPGNLVIYVEKFHFEFCPAENCKKKKNEWNWWRITLINKALHVKIEIWPMCVKNFMYFIEVNIECRGVRVILGQAEPIQAIYIHIYWFLLAQNMWIVD